MGATSALVTSDVAVHISDAGGRGGVEAPRRGDHPDGVASNAEGCRAAEKNKKSLRYFAVRDVLVDYGEDGGCG